MKAPLKTLGNILIAFSALGFLLVSFPFLLSHLPQESKPIGNAYAIVIPKINASSLIVVGVDPWNRAEYNLALSRGIAQAKNTSLPGERGLIYLFAHSSGFPWEVLDKNIPFLRLGELGAGDKVLLYRDGKEYVFTVSEKKVVAAAETKYLKNTGESVLILQTCWPLGTDWKRLLVFAVPTPQK